MSGKIVTSEAQYLDLLREIYESAPKKSDRTGTGTISVFGREMRFDLQEGFPLLTTKKVFLRSVIHELLWFLQGTGNIEYLAQNNVHIWDEWPFKAYLEKNNLPIPDVNSDEWNGQMKGFIKKVATDHGFAQKWGNLGPVYGVQWRKWPDGKGGTVDQIANAIETIKNNPNSRRIIVSAWNPAEVDTIVQIGGLPPCHMLFQFYVNGGKLSLRLDQRSADMFLGVPFNIASYSLLLMMVAQVTGLVPYELIIHFGDAHIYSNHIEQAREQLSREMRELPEVRLNSEVVGIDDFTIDDFELVGYDPHPAIKAAVAV